MYNYLATNADGFVDQIIRYVNTGHYFYVTGQIPASKDVKAVDTKLIERFEVALPRWTRCRRKQSGIASVHYLRFERFFILLATHGRHKFFECHSQEQVLDCRRVGIKFEGYSIRRRYSNHTQKWHTLVRLDKETYSNLRAYLIEKASRRNQRDAEELFSAVWFQPYRPVREQLLNILREVNRRRKAFGLPLLRWDHAIRNRRRIRTVFDAAN